MGITRFVPVVERIIERRHSQVTKKIRGRPSGAPLVSLALRLPETVDAMEKDPGLLPALAEKFEQVRNQEQLVDVMGFGCHPRVIEARSTAFSDARHMSLRRINVKILYGLDLESQFERYEKARASNQQRRNLEEKLARTDLKD